MPLHSSFSLRRCIHIPNVMASQKSHIELVNFSRKVIETALTILILAIIPSWVSSCSSSRTFVLTCQERQIEIYVDDNYLGRDMVYYNVPKGQEYIEISCRDNGTEVYHRRVSVSGRNGNLIEIQIPKNYKYNSNPF